MQAIYRHNYTSQQANISTNYSSDFLRANKFEKVIIKIKK